MHNVYSEQVLNIFHPFFLMHNIVLHYFIRLQTVQTLIRAGCFLCRSIKCESKDWHFGPTEWCVMV